MEDRMVFCWYRDHLFVGSLSTVNGVIQPIVEYNHTPAIVAILSEGGSEITPETAERLGWSLY